MTTLSVGSSARDLGILHPVACILHGIEVKPDTEGVLDSEVATVSRVLAEAAETILSRPEVQGFEELFAKMGYPDQTPAGRRLIETFAARGFKRINNVVDAYNVASCLFGSGLGLHDFASVNGDVRVFRAEGNEQIVPLFKTKPIQLRKGDLTYSSGSQILACLGARDVDSDAAKVSETTRAAILIALGNTATSEEYNRAACQKATELIQKTCPSVKAEFLNVEFEH